MPEEIDLLLDPGIFAEVVRQQEAALLVRLTADDVGKERAQAAGLGRRRSLAALDDALPLLLGIDRQAGVQRTGNIERAAELLAQLGGNEQPSLGVKRVLVFAELSLTSAPFCSHFIHFAPLRL